MTRGERAEQAYALFRDLLKIDTTNPPGNEAAAAEVVERFLSAAGLRCQRVEKAPGRTNLLTRTGSGGRALLLSAHLDVVPCVDERWSVPPFDAVEKDGYIYGRGAVDMKNFAAMAAVLIADLAKKKLPREVIGAFIADEEAGCQFGSKFLVEEHAELVRAECMLGEGGGFTQYAAGVRFYPIGRAEKGHLVLRLSFKGVAGHASMPHPGNAAFKAGVGLAQLSPGCLPLHTRGPAADFLQRLGRAAGVRGLPIRALTSPLAPLMLALLPVELSTALRPMISHTVSPTMFKGSNAINIIPDVVTADLDVRVLPGYSAQQVIDEVRGVVGPEVKIEALEFTPGVESAIDTPLFAAIEKAVPRQDAGAPAIPYMIAGFTDASYYRRLGMDCYGFSPLVLTQKDAEEVRFRMHGNDERVSKEAFLKGYALLEDAVTSFLNL